MSIDNDLCPNPLEHPWIATSVHIHGFEMVYPWTVQIQIRPRLPLRQIAEVVIMLLWVSGTPLVIPVFFFLVFQSTCRFYKLDFCPYRCLIWQAFFHSPSTNIIIPNMV